MESIDLKNLIKAGVHFGHRTSRWSPKMAPFIWGSKSKIHLIDISKTALLLNRAANYLKKIGSEGRSVLWIGTKKPAQAHILRIASQLDMPSVTHRWVGGTLSNYDQIKKAITRYLHLQDVIKKSASHYTKKEISMLQKEIARLEKNVGGIVNLSYPPAAIVLVDAKHERAAVKEAVKLGIPVIAMVDTNTDPSDINFVIPANDDSSKSIELIINLLGDAFRVGREEYEQKKAEEKSALKAKKESDLKKKPEKKAESVETSEAPLPIKVAPEIEFNEEEDSLNDEFDKKGQKKKPLPRKAPANLKSGK